MSFECPSNNPFSFERPPLQRVLLGSMTLPDSDRAGAISLVPPSEFSLRPSQPPTNPELEQYKVQLEGNLDKYRAASSDLEKYLEYYIEKYQASCSELQKQQLEIIAAAHSMPGSERVLENPDDYFIPSADHLFLITADKIIKCMPKKLPQTPKAEQSSSICAGDGLSLDRGTQSHTESVISSTEPITEATRPSRELPSRRPRPRGLKTYSKRDSARFQVPQPRATKASSTASTTTFASQPSADRKAVVRGYSVSQATEEAWSLGLNLTAQNPMRRNKVSKAKLWVFPYVLGGQIALYVFTCPKNCGTSIFSGHPLKVRRAEKHLRRCGLEFKGEEDMVRRYAQQVTREWKDRPVTVRWALGHNNNLLPGNDKSRHMTDLE